MCEEWSGGIVVLALLHNFHTGSEGLPLLNMDVAIIMCVDDGEV